MGAENRAVDPYDLPRDASLGDLLRVLARTIKLSIRTHVPAQIVAFDPARNKATVLVQTLPVVKVTDPAKIPEQILSLKGVPPNAEATLAPIQLVDIPVVWPRTNAGRITFPLVTGDTGELHIHDRSLDLWLVAGIPSDPVLAFTHALKDSVFHPGLHADVNPIVPPVDITATVVEGVPSIKLGAAAALAAARATDPLTSSANLTTWALAVEAALLAATSPILPASSWGTLLLAAAAQLGTITTGSVKTKIE